MNGHFSIIAFNINIRFECSWQNSFQSRQMNPRTRRQRGVHPPPIQIIIFSQRSITERRIKRGFHHLDHRKGETDKQHFLNDQPKWHSSTLTKWVVGCPNQYKTYIVWKTICASRSLIDSTWSKRNDLGLGTFPSRKRRGLQEPSTKFPIRRCVEIRNFRCLNKISYFVCPPL